MAKKFHFWGTGCFCRSCLGIFLRSTLYFWSVINGRVGFFLLLVNWKFTILHCTHEHAVKAYNINFLTTRISKIIGWRYKSCTFVEYWFTIMCCKQFIANNKWCCTMSRSFTGTAQQVKLKKWWKTFPLNHLPSEVSPEKHCKKCECCPEVTNH